RERPGSAPKKPRRIAPHRRGSETRAGVPVALVADREPARGGDDSVSDRSPIRGGADSPPLKGGGLGWGWMAGRRWTPTRRATRVDLPLSGGGNGETTVRQRVGVTTLLIVL